MSSLNGLGLLAAARPPSRDYPVMFGNTALHFHPDRPAAEHHQRYQLRSTLVDPRIDFEGR